MTNVGRQFATIAIRSLDMRQLNEMVFGGKEQLFLSAADKNHEEMESWDKDSHMEINSYNHQLH